VSSSNQASQGSPAYSIPVLSGRMLDYYVACRRYLNHREQKIADLEMQLEEMARSHHQEAIISGRMTRDASSSRVTQSGGTYRGSITTSSGDVRQGNDLAGKLGTYN
jgi:hypothetical protein